MYERLRNTHPRIGKAAYEAWDLANPQISDLRCPTCDEVYERPLKVEREESEDTFFLASTRSLLLPMNPPYLECRHGHRWTLSSVTYRDGAPYRLSFGHFAGWCAA
jgi:hypothetical protein